MGRRTISEKDKKIIGEKCCNCGSTDDLQYHHIVPLINGGNDCISNMCCLCYKCHYILHHNKKSNTNNYSELIKKGQARARSNGKRIGRKGNEIMAKFLDGKVKIFENSKQASEFFGVTDRCVEKWVHKEVTDFMKRKYKLLDIYITRINHNQTSNRFPKGKTRRVKNRGILLNS